MRYVLLVLMLALFGTSAQAAAESMPDLSALVLAAADTISCQPHMVLFLFFEEPARPGDAAVTALYVKPYSRPFLVVVWLTPDPDNYAGTVHFDGNVDGLVDRKVLTQDAKEEFPVDVICKLAAEVKK